MALLSTIESERQRATLRPQPLNRRHLKPKAPSYSRAPEPFKESTARPGPHGVGRELLQQVFECAAIFVLDILRLGPISFRHELFGGLPLPLHKTNYGIDKHYVVHGHFYIRTTYGAVVVNGCKPRIRGSNIALGLEAALGVGNVRNRII